VRQLASRARRHVAAGTPRVDVDAQTHDSVVTAFLLAAAGGDVAGLVALLDPDALLTSDGGGVVSAARRPVVRPDRVARFLVGVTARRSGDTFLPAVVNGRLGLVALAPDADGSGVRRRLVMSLTVDGGLVSRVDIVMAPDKLGG